MKKIGRPSKYRNELLVDAKLLAGLGFSERDFCYYWGIKRATFYRWKNKNEEALRDAIEEGKLEANLSVVKQLYKIVNKGNLNAIEYWLNNRSKEEWKNRNGLIVNQNTKVVNVNPQNFESLSDSEIDGCLDKVGRIAERRQNAYFPNLKGRIKPRRKRVTTKTVS